MRLLLISRVADEGDAFAAARTTYGFLPSLGVKSGKFAFRDERYVVGTFSLPDTRRVKTTTQVSSSLFLFERCLPLAHSTSFHVPMRVSRLSLSPLTVRAVCFACLERLPSKRILKREITSWRRGRRETSSHGRTSRRPRKNTRKPGGTLCFVCVVRISLAFQ